MKIQTIMTSTALITLLSVPTVSMAGNNFEQAKNEAIVELDKAKAAGFEWRDSRKILKKAEDAAKAGNNDEAIKLANQAKKQGMDAVVQAKVQENAGPR
jgi:hypothetical protein